MMYTYSLYLFLPLLILDILVSWPNAHSTGCSFYVIFGYNSFKKIFNGFMFVASAIGHRSNVHMAPSVAKIGTKILYM